MILTPQILANQVIQNAKRRFAELPVRNQAQASEAINRCIYEEVVALVWAERKRAYDIAVNGCLHEGTEKRCCCDLTMEIGRKIKLGVTPGGASGTPTPIPPPRSPSAEPSSPDTLP